jgi:hypothetical protein
MFARALPAIFAFAALLPVAAPALAGETADDSARHIRALRAEAATLRTEAEATFQRAEQDCHRHILVNRCINDAKAERLAAIRNARDLETEARHLDLAERQRAAAAITAKATEHGITAPTAPTSPMPDVTIIPSPPPAESSPAAQADNRPRPNAQTSDSARNAATRRAEAAQRDRERYEARIREYEEKRARDAAGR